MPPRNFDAPGWSGNDRLADREERVATGTGRLSLWTGQIMLVLILIVGSAIVFSGVLSDPVESTHPVVLRGHTQLVEAVAFAPDGSTLASCGWDNSVHIWDVARLNDGSKAERAILPHGSVQFAVAFSPDGKLLTACGQNSLTIWSSELGRYTPVMETEGHTYRCLAFSPDGRTLALGVDDGSVQFWDVSSRTERLVVRGHADVVRSVAFSPDGRHLVSSGQDRQIILWDAIRGVSVRSLGFSGGNAVQIVAYSPDGREIAVGEVTDSPQDVILLDPETGKVRTRLTGHRSGVSALAFTPDGHTLASAGVDRCIKLWDLTGGDERASLSDGVGLVRSLSFSVDGAWLAFAGSDCTVKVWDLASGRSHVVGRAPLSPEPPRWEPRPHDANKVG